MNEEKSSCQIDEYKLKSRVNNCIAVPYGWQRRILSSDLVVYLSPTNAILDSFESIRRYLEMPNSCKCGLQCPLIVEKVFNFDPTLQSKSWEVTQVLEGTHCRQKSNILEMATLTNCIDSFDADEDKIDKRLKRTNTENSIESMPTTPSKRPRGRPRKSMTTTSPNGKIEFIDRSPPTTTTTNLLFSTLKTGGIKDSNSIVQHFKPSRLDDAGHYLIVNGLVQPRTLNTLLKTLRNSSSFSGVDHLIETIEKFEQTQFKSTSNERISVKKPSIRRRVTKKISNQCQMQMNEVMITPVQTDVMVNSLDFSSNSWSNDPTLNSLLFHEDFHFDDFDSYLSVDQSTSSSTTTTTEKHLIFASHLL